MNGLLEVVALFGITYGILGGIIYALYLDSVNNPVHTVSPPPMTQREKDDFNAAIGIGVIFVLLFAFALADYSNPRTRLSKW